MLEHERRCLSVDFGVKVCDEGGGRVIRVAV